MVKHTPSRHERLDTTGTIEAGDSKESLEQALAAMKRVTEMVNEGKNSNNLQ